MHTVLLRLLTCLLVDAPKSSRCHSCLSLLSVGHTGQHQAVLVACWYVTSLGK